MIDRIVFIKRQSPDWISLARDFRAGISIDPARFVPDHEIPEFPPNIIALVEAWNRRFKIDFFTVRSIIADLSDECIDAAKGASRSSLAEIGAILDLAQRERFIAFFYDDDDFFTNNLFELLRETNAFDYDTCVFPLYRVHANLLTFARADMNPHFILGRRAPFGFRFQSNNYGISSRICTEENLRSLKDHMEASVFAAKKSLTEKSYSFVASATVKTPASASQLRLIFEDEATLRAQFLGFAARFSKPELPSSEAWLSRPLKSIARLLSAVFEGRDIEDVADLIPSAR